MKNNTPDSNDQVSGSSVDQQRLVQWEVMPADDMQKRWELIRPDGTSAATVWENGTWYTWDADSNGGENSKEVSVLTAQMAAILSAINQGFLTLNA